MKKVQYLGLALITTLAACNMFGKKDNKTAEQTTEQAATSDNQDSDVA